MKPDFFDDLDNYCPQDNFKDEIDTYLEHWCESRYILVIELFSEEEINRCEKCKTYNDRIGYFFDTTFLSTLLKTENFVAFAIDTEFTKSHNHKYLEKISKIKTPKKRVYIFDLEDGFHLKYTSKIENNYFTEELNYILNTILNTIKTTILKNTVDIEENKVLDCLNKYVYKDTATIKIENVNSTISDIPQEAKDLVNIVANDDEIINKSFDVTVRLDSNNSFYRWYNFLLSQITVYLVNPDSMPTMEDYLKKYELKEDDIDNITTQTTMPKALGCHYSKPKNINNKDVTICICPELIESFAESVGIDKNTAYAKVIIHEFAHAMMDEQKIVKLYNDKPYLDYINSNRATLNPIFHFVMEESIANCITLNKFHAATLDEKDTIINDVNKFIEHQPDAYKFGIKQFEAKIKVCKWRTMKKKINATKADEWLRKYFFNSEPYNAEAFDNLFETESN